MMNYNHKSEKRVESWHGTNSGMGVWRGCAIDCDCGAHRVGAAAEAGPGGHCGYGAGSPRLKFDDPQTHHPARHGHGRECISHGHPRACALGRAGARSSYRPMLRAEMCSSCACRPGTVPNGCLQTQMDFLKSAHEGKPFRCHAPSDGRICTGWLYARAEIAANPLPPQAVALLDKWDYTPADATGEPA